MRFTRTIDIAISDEEVLEGVRQVIDIPSEQIGLITQHTNEYGATLKHYTTIEHNGLTHIVEGSFDLITALVRNYSQDKIGY